MSIFCCPVCASPLTREELRYHCANGHSYDRSAAGHVHLLPGKYRHSRQPGDDKDMVRARAAFLTKGYYDCLRDALAAEAALHCPVNGCILDCGCGEGYYTDAIQKSLPHDREGVVAGIDLAKHAVQLASRRNRDIEFAVATAHHLPVGDASIDVLLSCFSPVVGDEFSRVLRTGGFLILVEPAPNHLWELKSLLYERPYVNKRNDYQLAGFCPVKQRTVQDTILLTAQADIQNLYRMTPYYWKTSQKGADKLDPLESLSTEISFYVSVYRKD